MLDRFCLPVEIMNDPRIRFADVKVLAVISAHAHSKHNVAYPSSGTIGDYLGMASANVRRSLIRLRDAGYITELSQTKNGTKVYALSVADPPPEARIEDTETRTTDDTGCTTDDTETRITDDTPDLDQKNLPVSPMIRGRITGDTQRRTLTQPSPPCSPPPPSPEGADERRSPAAHRSFCGDGPPSGPPRSDGAGQGAGFGDQEGLGTSLVPMVLSEAGAERRDKLISLCREQFPKPETATLLIDAAIKRVGLGEVNRTVMRIVGGGRRCGRDLKAALGDLGREPDETAQTEKPEQPRKPAAPVIDPEDRKSAASVMVKIREELEDQSYILEYFDRLELRQVNGSISYAIPGGIPPPLRKELQEIALSAWRSERPDVADVHIGACAAN